MRIKSINTPFGGISWETDESESKLAVHLLDFLEGKRVLFNDCKYGCENCKERSEKSVLEIKKYTSDMLLQLSRETDFKRAVRCIRHETNKFLTDIDFAESYVNIIYSKNKAYCPILKYRKEMAVHILNIMDMFNIREVGDLSRMIQQYIE